MRLRHYATLSGARPCAGAKASDSACDAACSGWRQVAAGRRGSRLCGAFVLCGSLLFGVSSSAHIDLLSPPPRVGGFPDSNLRQRPCGQRTTGRVADKVSVFRPGEVLSVTWDVYVQHSSYFRLAFDLDGADSFSDRPAAPAKAEQDDPTLLPAGEGEFILGYIEDKAGQLDHVEHDVILPSRACDNCTLQLIQFSYGLPIEQATYYQCADIVLEGEPVPPVAQTEPATQGGVMEEEVATPETESGCELGTPSPSSTTPAVALPGVLALVWLARRRAS
jgi:BIM1-like copper acquisition factor